MKKHELLQKIDDAVSTLPSYKTDLIQKQKSIGSKRKSNHSNFKNNNLDDAAHLSLKMLSPNLDYAPSLISTKSNQKKYLYSSRMASLALQDKDVNHHIRKTGYLKKCENILEKAVHQRENDKQDQSEVRRFLHARHNSLMIEDKYQDSQQQMGEAYRDASPNKMQAFQRFPAKIKTRSAMKGNQTSMAIYPKNPGLEENMNVLHTEQDNDKQRVNYLVDNGEESQETEARMNFDQIDSGDDNMNDTLNLEKSPSYNDLGPFSDQEKIINTYKQNQTKHETQNTPRNNLNRIEYSQNNLSTNNDN